jgi:hypothetical protein
VWKHLFNFRYCTVNGGALAQPGLIFLGMCLQEPAVRLARLWELTASEFGYHDELGFDCFCDF